MATGTIIRNFFDTESVTTGVNCEITMPLSNCKINNNIECSVLTIGRVNILNATLTCTSAVAAYSTFMILPTKFAPNASNMFGHVISANGGGISSVYFLGGSTSPNIANRS